MSLNGVLSGAVTALNADTAALQLTNNNLANANTPGYTRKVAEFETAVPTNEDGVDTGSGVDFAGYQSQRAELITAQLQQQTGAQSSADAQSSTLQSIQPTFTTSTQDLGTELSAFFSSVSSLSTNPANSPLREAVVSAGQNLAQAFHNTSSALTGQDAGLNTQVGQDVNKINQITQQIAVLNPQIAYLQATNQDTGTLQDQRDQLVLNLSALTNVAVTQTNDGETITTGNGTALVVGEQSYALQTAPGSDGNLQVLDSNGNNVTASISSGDLGGTIQTRDQTIPGLLSTLDTLANQFATSFNAAQAEGYDQSGTAGQNFFTVPSTVAGSAGTIAVATTDPTKIAASSDGTAGGGGNLANLSAVATTLLPGGQTPTATYASLVYQVGSLASNAQSESTATGANLKQLNDQLSSVSGVSVDEETSNLLTYQTAYEAAARVVTTVQSLFETVLEMGTAAAE